MNYNNNQLTCCMIFFRQLDSFNSNLFKEVVHKLHGQFQLKEESLAVGEKLIHQFDELKKYHSLFLHKCVSFTKDKESFYILLIEKHYVVREVKGTTSSARFQDSERQEVEPILIFEIGKNMGNVFIRKETLGDKIEDIFTKVDIDIKDYPGFSSNYLMVSDKPDLEHKNFPPKFLEVLDKVPDLVVEIKDGKTMVRTECDLTENILLLLISIGNKVMIHK